jgi:hypothetical protein
MQAPIRFWRIPSSAYIWWLHRTALSNGAPEGLATRPDGLASGSRADAGPGQNSQTGLAQIVGQDHGSGLA